MPERQSGWQELGREVVLQNSTGLRWTKKDNGQDINWFDAKSYCAKLGDGWRLPTVEELRDVYAVAERSDERNVCGGAVCKAPPQLHLSSAWYWSGTAVTKEQSYDFDELAWGVTMVNGRKTMALQFAPYAARAMCVRAP